jgi:hypothetical protein
VEKLAEKKNGFLESDGADRLQDAGQSVRGFDSPDQDPCHRAAAALPGRAGDKARQSAGPLRSVRHPSRGLSVCGIISTIRDVSTGS